MASYGGVSTSTSLGRPTSSLGIAQNNQVSGLSGQPQQQWSGSIPQGVQLPYTQGTNEIPMEQALNRVFPRGIPAVMEQFLAPNMEPDFGSFRRQSGQSSLDSVISLPELRYDVMVRYPGYQVESSDPAPTKPTSLGLANFQQAKPAKDANLPLSPSIEAWLICQAQAIEGKDRLGKVTKAPLGPKTYPKLPSLKAERFEPSNAPSFLRVGQLPRSGIDWSQTRARSPLKLLVSLGQSSASSNLRFRRCSLFSRIWTGGLPGYLTSQRIYNPIYLKTRISSLLEYILRGICSSHAVPWKNSRIR